MILWQGYQNWKVKEKTEIVIVKLLTTNAQITFSVFEVVAAAAVAVAIAAVVPEAELEFSSKWNVWNRELKR